MELDLAAGTVAANDIGVEVSVCRLGTAKGGSEGKVPLMSGSEPPLWRL